MYPARWFPVNDYTTDRFSSDLKVTVPAGYQGGGERTRGSEEAAPAGMTATRFKFDQASFPGSFAVVRGDAKPITPGGITTYLLFARVRRHGGSLRRGNRARR